MKQDKAIAAIMSKQDAVLDKYKDLTIIQHMGPSVCIFQDKKSKPIYYYKFKTDEQRTAFIEDQKKAADRREEHDKLREQNAKAKADQILPGAVLYSSWGYEQTNIDFYKVLERKGSTVKLIEIGQMRVEDGDMSGKCTADISREIGVPFTKRIAQHGGINLNSFSWCGLWDGQPKYWSSYN